MMNMKQLWQKYWAAYSGIPKEIWLLLIAVLINRIGNMVVFFLALYFHMKLHFSVGQIGILLTLYGVGNVMGSFTGGLLCDYIHPRKLLIFSFYAVAVMLVVVSFFKHFVALSAILVLYGVVVASASPACNLMLNEYATPENRLKVFGLYRVVMNLGISMTGLIGGFVAEFDFIMVFYINAAGAFIAATTLYYLSKKRLPAACYEEKPVPVPFKRVLTDRYFMSLWVLILVFLGIVNQCLSTYPIYLQTFYGFQPSHVGWMFTINGLLIVLCEVPLLSYLGRFLPLNVVAAGGAILASVGFGILPFGDAFWFAAISCAMWTVGEILTIPTSLTMALNHVEGMSKGRYMAVYYVATSSANVLAPIMGTSIYHHFGGANLWYFCIVLGVGLSFGYVLLLKRQDHFPPLPHTQAKARLHKR